MDQALTPLLRYQGRYFDLVLASLLFYFWTKTTIAINNKTYAMKLIDSQSKRKKQAKNQP